MNHSSQGRLESLTRGAEFDGLDAGSWSNTLLTYATNDYYTEDEETNYSYWLNVQSDGTLVSFWEHDNGSNVTLTSTTPAAPGRCTKTRLRKSGILSRNDV